MRSTDITAHTAALNARVDTLVAVFQSIATTRMQGIPLLNPALRVQAVGFVQAIATDHEADSEPAAVGVLIAPWFMNLVWLPIKPVNQGHTVGQVGSKVPRHVGRECFEFIRAFEDDFGSFEACSLFSPVFEFVDQAAAVATAWAVLQALRQPEIAKATPPVATPPLPARRAFLLGRGRLGHG